MRAIAGPAILNPSTQGEYSKPNLASKNINKFNGSEANPQILPLRPLNQTFKCYFHAPGGIRWDPYAHQRGGRFRALPAPLARAAPPRTLGPGNKNRHPR